MHGINSINGAYVSDESSVNNNTVNASLVGSTDTAVLRFDALAIIVGDITQTTTVTAGTIVSFTSAGYYMITLAFTFAGAVTVAGGISIGAAAAPIVANPVIGVDGVRYSLSTLGVAASDRPFAGTITARIDQARIAAGTATLRFHATNGAGAAPVGITAGSAQYRVEKISDLST